MHGIVDEKIDVFSYGVLVLELITGRQALDESQKSLVIWVSYVVYICMMIILDIRLCNSTYFKTYFEGKTFVGKECNKGTS